MIHLTWRGWGWGDMFIFAENKILSANLIEVFLSLTWAEKIFWNHFFLFWLWKKHSPIHPLKLNWWSLRNTSYQKLVRLVSAYMFGHLMPSWSCRGCNEIKIYIIQVILIWFDDQPYFDNKGCGFFLYFKLEFFNNGNVKKKDTTEKDCMK